jgi:hypothetical protein
LEGSEGLWPGSARFFLAVVLTLGAVLLMVATCGHRNPLLNRLGLGQLVAPPQESPPAVPNVPPHSGPLPGIWELDDLFGGAKSTRNGSQVVIAGADYSEADSTTGREESIEVEDTSLNLRAYEPGDFTYAVFGQLVGDGVMGGGRDDDIPLQSLFQTEPCDYGGGRDDDIPLSFYIGIADYTLGSWRWFGPFSDADPEVSLNNDELQDRFKSPSDMLYIAVLAAAGGKQISQLPREGLVAGLPFEPPERAASQLEDPAGVRVKAIVTDTDSGIGTLPQAVTGLSAVVGGSSITLSWDANPDPDVTSYEIYRKEAGIEGPPVWLDSVTAPATGYDDIGAEAGVTYLYGVQAVNDVGPGGIGYVSVGPPVIRGVSPTSGKEGASVKIVAIVSGSQPFTYAWDFGGGATPNTSTEARPTVTLGDAGEYNASVVVTNEYSSDTFDFTLIAQQSGGWHSVTVDGEGYKHYFSSIATVNGNPAISYCDATPEDGDLKYVRASDANGSSWGTPVTVDSEGVTGACTSLAIINGNPAIIYLSVLGVTEQCGDLKYVRATDASGSSWGTPVTVDSTGDVGFGGSLVVANGYPAIIYYDGTNGDLKYAYFAP